ncbi:MAG: methyl-accepting chemotaxis protein [Deltaproteobacteria bacterium]|nr:methyl-accepting chemotaxis protein [Deltaproteobacteria bacterium]
MESKTKPSSHHTVSIRTKLVSIIASIALAAVGGAVYAAWAVHENQDESNLVNISGRQRMLTQKMTKEALQIADGLQIEKSRKELGNSFKLFEKSHTALLHGNPEMGIRALDDEEAIARMAGVETIWEGEVKPAVQVILTAIPHSPPFEAALEKLTAKNLDLLQAMNHVTARVDEHAQESMNQLMVLLFSIGGAALLFSLFSWFLVERLIVVPLRKTMEMIGQLSQGHLASRLHLAQHDEIGQMAETMDHFAEDLKDGAIRQLSRIADGDLTYEMAPKDGQDEIGNALLKTRESLVSLVGEVQLAAQQIGVGSSQVSDASQALSNGATQQAASLEETSSSLNEMAGASRENATSAHDAFDMASKARSDAEVGLTRMAEMLEAMESINQSNLDISKVIKMMDDFAFQTSILAINAAIQSAQAGVKGRAFSVVADEVRALANRSLDAAKETGQMIEASLERSANGVALAKSTAEVFRGICSEVDEVSDLVGRISDASTSQAAGVGQVSKALTQVEEVTQQTAAQSEELLASSEELASQVEALRHMLSRFRLSETGSGKARVIPMRKAS